VTDKDDFITRKFPCPADWLRFEAVHTKSCFGWSGYSIQDNIQWVDEKGRFCLITIYPDGRDQCRTMVYLVPKDKVDSMRASFATFEAWLKAKLEEKKKDG